MGLEKYYLLCSVLNGAEVSGVLGVKSYRQRCAGSYNKIFLNICG
jgi:hypothetical protein